MSPLVTLGQREAVHYRQGAWHIGVHRMAEATCPCPKADCGLAIPVAAIPCRYHHGALRIRQHHRSDSCPRSQART